MNDRLEHTAPHSADGQPQGLIRRLPFHMFEAQPELTRSIHDEIALHALKAAQELQEMGISGEILSSVRDMKTVELEGDDKTRLMDHLFDALDITAKVKALEKRPEFTARYLSYQITSLLDAVRQSNVQITGPLIELRCTSPQAMGLFNLLSESASVGLALPFPMKSDAQEGLIFSDSLRLSVVDIDEHLGNQDTQAHEQWHTYMALCSALKNGEDAGDQAGVVLDDPDGLIAALAEYLYKPNDLARYLTKLRDLMPEAYDYYVSIPIEADQFRRSLMTLQHELPALIAGYVYKYNGIISDFHQDIIDSIVGGYSPFKHVNKDDLTWLTGYPRDDTYTVKAEQIDNLFNPKAAYPGQPPPERDALIDAYSQRDFTRLATRVVDEARFTRHAQMLLDSVYRPTGVLYTYEKRIKDQLERTLKSFEALSEHYFDGNYDHRLNASEQALIELSQLPMSQWEKHVQETKERKGGV